MKQKLLFICSRNKWRSPTAEDVWRNLGYATRSAGTSRDAVNPVSLEDLRWAEHIFVMEVKHRQRLLAAYARVLAHKPLHVLHIPDNYQYQDPALVNLLKQKVEPFLR
ncbi:phosphotyrosine protein phosphatase [Pseudomonas sp. F1_0610]|uniref:low molecular weight protein tyrosine phosphatase family protein n=1 Tax=Pseudomonas sp. F1_0610 TaxID=3114284 RepID=UPI0039C11491